MITNKRLKIDRNILKHLNYKKKIYNHRKQINKRIKKRIAATTNLIGYYNQFKI